jgi:acetyl esterase
MYAVIRCKQWGFRLTTNPQTRVTGSNGNGGCSARVDSLMGRNLRLLLLFMIVGRIVAAPVNRGVEYGRAGDAPLLLDASIPEGSGPFPAVIIVHGGGWIGGHREHSVQPLFEPLSKAGFAWFSISYRLATSFMQLGVAVDDVQSAVAFVKANAHRYNVDPDRLAILGESAGAHLAALAVERAPASVAAVVALYPPTDLVSLAGNARSIPESLRQVVRAAGMEGLITGYLRELSPIAHVKPGLPPFLLIHGTADTIVPYNQSEQMLAKLLENGVKAELMTVDGGGHGLRAWELSHRLSAYRSRMITWLQSRLAQKPEPSVQLY